MSIRRGLSHALLTAAVAGSVVVPGALGSQQTPRDRLLVTAEWLLERVGEDDLVLLHVGPEEDYAREHIPGARHVDLRAISHPDSHGDGSLILELPEADVLQETLRDFGISDDSRIVVYWGEEWVTPTARTAYTLDWAGLGDRTALLDGGLGAWKAAGGEVTDAGPPEARGDVTVRPRNELVADAEWVVARLDEPGFAVIDARAAAFFDGVREDRGKAGHLPGAGSVPWPELIDESTRLKDPEALRAMFEAAGVKPGDTVVAYCHIGQYATLALFAARTLGHEVVLYDGAMQDWAARNLPVVEAEE